MVVLCSVAVERLVPDLDVKGMVEVMRTCYWDAVRGAEHERGGTTFTAGLLQLNSMIFSTLQAPTHHPIPNPQSAAHTISLFSSVIPWWERLILTRVSSLTRRWKDSHVYHCRTTVLAPRTQCSTSE